jgi:hypothetical protein
MAPDARVDRRRFLRYLGGIGGIGLVGACKLDLDRQPPVADRWVGDTAPGRERSAPGDSRALDARDGGKSGDRGKLDATPKLDAPPKLDRPLVDWPSAKTDKLIMDGTCTSCSGGCSASCVSACAMACSTGCSGSSA